MGYPIQCVPLWCKLANITNINHSYKPTTNSYKRTSTNSYKTMFVREISSINHSFSASDVWQPTLSNGGPHPVDRRPWSQQKTPGGLGLGQIFPGFSQGSVEKPPWNMGAFGGFRCSCPIFRNEMMVELIEFLLLHGNGSGVEKTIPPMTLWSLQLFSIFPGNTNPMMGKKNTRNTAERWMLKHESMWVYCWNSLEDLEGEMIIFIYFYFPSQIVDILYTCRLGLDYHFGFPLPCAATRRIWTHQKRWTCFLRNDKNDASWPHKQQHQWYRRNHCEELLIIGVCFFFRRNRFQMSRPCTFYWMSEPHCFPENAMFLVTGHPICDQHVGAVATPPVTSWLIYCIIVSRYLLVI